MLKNYIKVSNCFLVFCGPKEENKIDSDCTECDKKSERRSFNGGKY